MVADTQRALALTLPLAPSSNHVYADGRYGRRVLTDEGRHYKSAVMWLVRAAVGTWRVPVGCRLAVTITLHFPDRRRCDIENRVKLLNDALAAALGYDDSQVDDLHIRRGDIDREDPRCDVTVAVVD